MTSKPKEPKMKEVPAPNAYSIQEKISVPSYVFGSEERSKLIKSEGPGPAAYNV